MNTFPPVSYAALFFMICASLIFSNFLIITSSKKKRSPLAIFPGAL